jgi:hypothetical protein
MAWASPTTAYLGTSCRHVPRKRSTLARLQRAVGGQDARITGTRSSRRVASTMRAGSMPAVPAPFTT